MTICSVIGNEGVVLTAVAGLAREKTRGAAGIVTKVSFTLTGLDSGKRYRVRVCAVGASGQGPWSDEALTMAA
jgi:hypothetical protein